jgi:hypothetical protein
MQSHLHQKITKWRDASNCHYRNIELGLSNDWLHIFHICLDLDVADWYTNVHVCSIDQTRRYQHEICCLGQFENPKAIIRCLDQDRGSFAVSNLYHPLSQG